MTRLAAFCGYCALSAFAFLLGVGIVADILERRYGRPQSRRPVLSPAAVPVTELPGGGSVLQYRSHVTTYIDGKTQAHP